MKRLAANAALLLVTVLVSFAFLEVAVRVLDLMGPAREAALTRRDTENAGAGTQANDAPASRWMIHPYRGITTRPGEQPPHFKDSERRNNIFGVVSDVSDPRELTQEDIVVGIFGGSVAMSTALEAGPVLERELSKAAWARGRRVSVVNFGIGGYKQPQQLYLLSEALLLGVPFDVVINLDGFNEVALGATDANQSHHPYLPNRSFWTVAFGSATGSLTLKQIQLTAAAVNARRRAADLRAGFEAKPWRHSAIAQALVGARASRADAVAVRMETNLQEVSETEGLELFPLGAPCLGKDFGCWPLILDLWKRSSLSMKALAEANGAAYFHALQPNQYLEGSKPMNDEELATAWAPKRPWSQAAAAAYPMLREAGRELESEGVAWLDLTQLFAGRTETIYKDPCCHYKTNGYVMIAEELARTIGARLEAESFPSGPKPEDGP